MAKTKEGGLYRNQGGQGFHDAHGKPVALKDVPKALLTEAELEELKPKKAAKGKSKTDEGGDGAAAAGAKGETPEGGDGAGDGDALPDGFPGLLALTNAGLKTKAAVFEHPNLADVKGLGPKTLAEIEELRPKADQTDAES